MGMYQAIIFDFFNVVYQDPATNFFKAINSKREGIYEDIFNRVDAGQTSMPQMCQELSTASGMQLPEVAAFWEQTELLDQKVVELIRELGTTYKLGLLSNARADYLRPILARNNLEDLFDVISISSETCSLKPDPQSFNNILKHLDTDAEKALFIDDNPRYIAAAESLGITSIQFSDAATLAQRSRRADGRRPRPGHGAGDRLDPLAPGRSGTLMVQPADGVRIGSNPAGKQALSTPGEIRGSALGVGIVRAAHAKEVGKRPFQYLGQHFEADSAPSDSNETQDVTSRRTLQSRRMYPTCSGLSSGFTGTNAQPADEDPKAATIVSKRLSR